MPSHVEGEDRLERLRQSWRRSTRATYMNLLWKLVKPSEQTRASSQVKEAPVFTRWSFLSVAKLYYEAMSMMF